MERNWIRDEETGEEYYFDDVRNETVDRHGRRFNSDGAQIGGAVATSPSGRTLEFPAATFPGSEDESTPFPPAPLTEDRYRFIRSLGEGTQASVSEYEDLYDERNYAIKLYTFPEYSDELRRNIMREIAIMGNLSQDVYASRYMVCLVRWHEEPQTHDIKVVMNPVASDGSLFDMLLKQFDTYDEIISERFLKDAVWNLTQGLAFIHQLSVRHKDISTQNVLIHHGRAIYTDFGISLHFDRLASATGASSYDNPTESTLDENTYAAPELLEGDPRSTKSDVFSLGCVIWEMLVARSVVVLRKRDYVAETGFGGGWGFEKGDGYAKRLRGGYLGKAIERMEGEEGMQEYGWIVDLIKMMIVDKPFRRAEASKAFDGAFGKMY